MIKFIIRRVLISIPILLIVITLVFTLVRSMPGGPAAVILGDYASAEAIQALKAEMGLDAPVWLQYTRFIGGLLKGDLGTSMINGLPIAPQIVRILPYTLELTISAIFFGIFFGIPLGVYTALKRNTTVDYLGRIFSLAGISIPSFFLGLLLILFFSIKLDLFPVVGGGDLYDISDNLYHLFLPTLTLGMLMGAYITRMTRSSLLNVLQEDYVRTARAKGLQEKKIIYGHALKNALTPVVSFIGVYAILLIGSSVLVEVVFSRPGLGKMMVGAISQRDYMTLQSIMVVYASLVILINLLTDILYGIIDPRIGFE